MVGKAVPKLQISVTQSLAGLPEPDQESVAAWLLTVPGASCWLLASFEPVLPRSLVREGPSAQEAPGDRGRTASAETGPGQIEEQVRSALDGAWNSQATKLRRGGTGSGKEGGSGRGYRCLQRGACITTGGPWQGRGSGPGGVGQDRGPENSESRPILGLLPLLSCPEPFHDTGVLCWRPQTQAYKQMQGPCAGRVTLYSSGFSRL